MISSPEIVFFRYAGFWRRVLAWTLDFMIVGIPLLIINGLFGYSILGISLSWGTAASASAAPWVIILSEASIFWTYFVAMESSSQMATIGKQALGIRVVDLDGNRITFEHASQRTFAKFVSMLTLGVGFAMAGITQKKQALHDKIMETLVITKTLH